MLDGAGFRAGLVSSFALAGTESTGFLDALPKAWLIWLVLALFAIVSYFAKRDYNRFTDAHQRSDERHAATEKILSQLLKDCVTVEALGSNNARMHSKMNVIGKRMTIIETKLGMYDTLSVPREEDEKEEGDESAG